MGKDRFKVLCITRKYPPIVGGMENMCYHVFKGLERDNLEVKVVSLGKKQFHLVWFFPYTVLYTLFNAHKYDCLLLGDTLMCFLGHVCRLVSKKTRRLIITYGLDFTFKNRLYQCYLRMFFRRSADEYICISRETQKNLANWGISYSKVITPGINIEKFDGVQTDKTRFRGENHIPEDNRVLITVGRLRRRKGVLWFLDQVMPLLRDLPITYLIIGEGPDREEIEDKISEKNLQDKVRLLGEVDDQKLLEYYCNADLFIMPNIPVPGDMEGFGIVALEASMAKLIVVASGIDGITDAVISEKNGYILESQNAAQYVEYITRIVMNYEEYAKHAEQFSEYTKKNYSWKNICDKYVDLMMDVPGVE